MNELEIKYELLSQQTDLSDVERAAESYAATIEYAPELADDVSAIMRDAVHSQLIDSLGSCSLAVVQTEYLYPLAGDGHIHRNPTRATSATVVIDTSADITIRTMPFKPDLMSDYIEWTGVGFVARIADRLDLTPKLRKIHEDFNLAPAVAVPLHHNLTHITSLLSSIS